MAILNFLKSKWSAGSMTEEDRQRIFWYLKRKTSYTAWKRRADRFGKFAKLVEKQVKEEPVVKDKHGDPLEWEPVYVGSLDGVVHYEKGLHQLRQGDRTTFLYDSLGELRDAVSISSEWHYEIVYGGHEADPDKYVGKYINEMKAALLWYFDAAQDTGYLQPRMANRSAVEVWEKERHERLLALPCSEPLPEVPIPTDITVRTGEPVPVFGIYEPQIKDGCMNYLLQSEPARSYSPTPVSYDGESVVWRLIWQDHRYEDGTIPQEESHYFPSDTVEPLVYIEPSSHRPDTLILAKTGSPASRSGRWVVRDDLTGAVRIEQSGDLLPQYQGRDVTWVWSSD